MASESNEQIADLDGEYARVMLAARPPRHIAVKAGDKIWVNRTRLAFRPDKLLSTEEIEVIDVVEKPDAASPFIVLEESDYVEGDLLQIP